MKEDYNRAKEALRAASLINHEIRIALATAIEQHGHVFDRAGMEEYKEAIIEEFWNGSFASIEAAKEEANIRMQCQSKLKYYSDRIMESLKIFMNNISAKAEMRPQSDRGISEIVFGKTFQKNARIKETTNAILSKSKIQLWQISAN